MAVKVVLYIYYIYIASEATLVFMNGSCRGDGRVGIAVSISSGMLCGNFLGTCRVPVLLRGGGVEINFCGISTGYGGVRIRREFFCFFRGAV